MTVTWRNAGFPETVADGYDWHQAITKAAGRADAFPYVSHLRPTAQAGLVLRLAAGEMVSGAVWSQNNANVDMPPLPALGSGQKYYLAVVRKTYGATAAEHVTSYEYIPGDANRVIPAFQQVPGEIWETPVALVKVKSGKSTFDELVDLRVIAEQPGVYTIYDDLALSLIDHPGAIVHNANTGLVQARVYNAALGRAWVKLSTPAAPVPPRYGQSSEYAPESVGMKSGSLRYYGVAVPPADYTRRITCIIAAHIRVTPGSVWKMLLQTAENGSPNTIASGTDRVSQPLIAPSGGGDQRPPVSITYDYICPAGKGVTFRAWLVKESGGSIEVANSEGLAGMVTWSEVAGGNEW